MSSTNYIDTFIAVSPDSAATVADRAPKPGSIAARQLALLQAQPYGLTSDELLFEVHAQRNGIAAADRDAARAAFFARPQACLRCSPLVKKHGWGLHHDAQGRVAAVAIGDESYRTLATRTDINQVRGMASRRAGRE